MKKIFSVVAIAAVMASCTSNPNANITAAPAQAPAAVDTTGLSQFQAWKRQQELMQLNEGFMPEAAPAAAVAAPVAAAAPVAKAPAVRRSTSSRSSSSNSGSMSSTSGNTAKAKKGWSKAAKGTAIGAGSGAVLGAVIN